MPGKSFSMGEAVQFGWAAVKRNFGFFIAIMIVVLGLNALPQLIEILADDSNMPIIATIAILLGWLTSAITTMGLARIALRFCDGEWAYLTDLFPWGAFWRYVAATILYTAMVTVFIFGGLALGALLLPVVAESLLHVAGVVIGMVLLLLPAIILALMFVVYPFVILDENAGPAQALVRSAAITKGARGQLFVFLVVLGFLNVLGAMLLGIGLLFTIPITFLSEAYVYRKLRAQTDAGVTTVPTPAVEQVRPSPA